MPCNLFDSLTDSVTFFAAVNSTMKPSLYAFVRDNPWKMATQFQARYVYKLPSPILHRFVESFWWHFLVKAEFLFWVLQISDVFCSRWRPRYGFDQHSVGFLCTSRLWSDYCRLASHRRGRFSAWPHAGQRGAPANAFRARKRPHLRRRLRRHRFPVRFGLSAFLVSVSLWCSRDSVKMNVLFLFL